jgi:hypothetical protein
MSHPSPHHIKGKGLPRAVFHPTRTPQYIWATSYWLERVKRRLTESKKQKRSAAQSTRIDVSVMPCRSVNSRGILYASLVELVATKSNEIGAANTTRDLCRGYGLYCTTRLRRYRGVECGSSRAKFASSCAYANEPMHTVAHHRAFRTSTRRQNLWATCWYHVLLGGDDLQFYPCESGVIQ